MNNYLTPKLANDETYNAKICREYLEILANRGYSFNTLSSYGYNFEKFLRFTEMHDLNILDLTPKDVFDFTVYLKSLDLSSRSINLHLSSLKSIYGYLLSLGEISYPPVNSLHYHRIDEYVRPAYTERDILKYLNFSKSNFRKDQYLAGLIMLYSGLRVSEVTELDLINDIEMRGSDIFIHVDKSKNHKARITKVFSKKTINMIIERRNLFLYGDEYKLNVTTQDYLYTRRLYKKKTGLNVEVHDFRRAFATARYHEGLDTNYIRLMLGHKNIQQTLDYIKIDRSFIYDLPSNFN